MKLMELLTVLRSIASRVSPLMSITRNRSSIQSSFILFIFVIELVLYLLLFSVAEFDAAVCESCEGEAAGGFWNCVLSNSGGERGGSEEAL